MFCDADFICHFFNQFVDILSYIFYSAWLFELSAV